MRFGSSLFFGNYKDWDRFFALEAGQTVPEPEVSDGQIWREELELAVLSDELGFDTFWTQEQHGAPYLMSPDPHVLMAYLAGRTKKIDFGSSITVLPWHDPFRVAEQISVFSHMIGDRRYFLGVGRGSAARNFDAMSIPMEESRERFNEVLDVLQLAFTKEIFSYEGKFFTYKNVSLRPRPRDPQVVIDALGAWTSHASQVNMAERGLHPITTPNQTLDSYLDEMEEFNQIRVEKGYGISNRPVIKIPMYCSESGQEATESAEQHFFEFVDAVQNMYEIGTDRFGTAKGYEDYHGERGSDFGKGTAEDARRVLTRKFMTEGVYGTPQQCVDKLIAHLESVNPSEYIALCRCGDMPYEKAERSMRLFAQEVLPKVRAQFP